MRRELSYKLIDSKKMITSHRARRIFVAYETWPEERKYSPRSEKDFIERMLQEFGENPPGAWDVLPGEVDSDSFALVAWLCALGPRGAGPPSGKEWASLLELYRGAETMGWYVKAAAEAMAMCGNSNAGEVLIHLLEVFGNTDPARLLADRLLRAKRIGEERARALATALREVSSIDEYPAVLCKAGLVDRREHDLLALALPVFTANMGAAQMVEYFAGRGGLPGPTPMPRARLPVDMISEVCASGLFSEQFGKSFERCAQTIRLRRILDIVTWWGLGGSGVIHPARTGWNGLWPGAISRLEWLAGKAAASVDRVLCKWLPQLREAAKPFLPARRLVDVLVRPLDRSRKGSLRLEFSPMPIRNDAPDELALDSEYGERWSAAGLTVSMGRMQIALCKPGTRFAFSITEGTLEVEGRPALTRGVRVVVRCGDLHAHVEAYPRIKGFNFKLGKQRVAEFRGEAKSSAFACQCGALRCNSLHHISSWEPDRHPYVPLVNFVFASVKGRPLAGRRFAAKNLREGIYYPFLASGRGSTAPAIRNEEVAQFHCDHCGRRHQSRSCEENSAAPISEGCRPVSATTRLFVCDLGTYSLKPYSRCRSLDYFYYLGDRQLCTEPRFERLIQLHSPPDWLLWNPARKKSWAQELDPSDPLALLAAPHWVPLTPGFNRSSHEDVLDRMHYARERRFVYGLILAEAIRAASRVPDRYGSRPAFSRRASEDQASLILEVAQATAWFYLLFDGFASPPESNAREKLFWEQGRQVEAETGQGQWCACSDRRLPERFRALWTKA